jgi:phosphoglycolate phosphatase-like HAD superfamily hydrolase
VKTLIFDFDGTLADSFDTLLAIFEQIHVRPQKLTAQEVADLRGRSIKEIISYLKIRRWRLPKLIIMAKGLLAAKIGGIKAFPGLPAALEQLHKQGYRMFILSTNSGPNISIFLKKNGLDNYFTAIYGDIGLRSKASALKKIVKKEKLVREDCVYIGDEVRDIEAARKAGVTSVGVSWGFNSPAAIKKARPDILAQKPKDLLNI